MNRVSPLLISFSYVFRFWLTLRGCLPRRTCQTFGVQTSETGPVIQKIYVINLDRAPGRWLKMQQELRRVLDSSRVPLILSTTRHVAVDAEQFSHESFKDADVDPFYTLAEQLFVEPQPLALPAHLDLTAPIRMSQAEIAIARSHIAVWRRVAESNHDYVLILEDDVWLNFGFAGCLDRAWTEIVADNSQQGRFDVLYVSYQEVMHGAPKTFLSPCIFRPVRGLWHLSGYVLSREGAKKLLHLLPCRGPIDLWINHQFKSLDVRATKLSLIKQRRDTVSSNSYSILPALTSIGAITSECAALFNIHPMERPVFAFGPKASGQSSLAMALSMLGYRCCSDLETLPRPELRCLLKVKGNPIFDAYVNIGVLDSSITELRSRYPKAKFIITTARGVDDDPAFSIFEDSLTGADVAVLDVGNPNKWKIICEHLRSAPPNCPYPMLEDLGQRQILDEPVQAESVLESTSAMRDKSRWVIESTSSWRGIRVVPSETRGAGTGKFVTVIDCLDYLDSRRWYLRSDTFTDNLVLFRPANVQLNPGAGAVFSIKKEDLGVRGYSGASLCSQEQYLYGKFEAIIQASNVAGVITGFFLHRNSPRQEIDIEIAGNRPNQLLVNVFYNPGGEGANFDYGYRGSPSYIDLKFDASKASHRYAIEWTPHEIRWLVDDCLVHKRVIWNPTPIPHLPMRLHINSWLTRSTRLAGRVSDRLLPAIIKVGTISLAANSISSSSESDYSSGQVMLSSLDSGKEAQ